MVPHWEILDPPLTCMLQYTQVRYSLIYCQLRHRKGTEFWCDKNEADQSDPRKQEVRRRLAGSWSSTSELCR